MTELIKEPLHKAGRSYVQKLIRIRKLMISKGFIQTNLTYQSIDELSKLLNYWPFKTNQKMARFIYTKADNILYLIPGLRCKSHEKLMKEFNTLYSKSRQLLNHAAIC